MDCKKTWSSSSVKLVQNSRLTEPELWTKLVWNLEQSINSLIESKLIELGHFAWKTRAYAFGKLFRLVQLIQNELEYKFELENCELELIKARLVHLNILLLMWNLAMNTCIHRIVVHQGPGWCYNSEHVMDVTCNTRI